MNRVESTATTTLDAELTEHLRTKRLEWNDRFGSRFCELMLSELRVLIADYLILYPHLFVEAGSCTPGVVVSRDGVMASVGADPPAFGPESDGPPPPEHTEEAPAPTFTIQPGEPTKRVYSPAYNVAWGAVGRYPLSITAPSFTVELTIPAAVNDHEAWVGLVRRSFRLRPVYYDIPGLFGVTVAGGTIYNPYGPDAPYLLPPKSEWNPSVFTKAIRAAASSSSRPEEKTTATTTTTTAAAAAAAGNTTAGTGNAVAKPPVVETKAVCCRVTLKCMADLTNQTISFSVDDEFIGTAYRDMTELPDLVPYVELYRNCSARFLNE